MRTERTQIRDAPDFRLNDDEPVGNALLNFYFDLGWDSETYTLNPMKIKTTKKVYNGLLEFMIERAKGKISDPDVSVGFLMVNNGPSVDDTVKSGKVYLLAGWISS